MEPQKGPPSQRRPADAHSFISGVWNPPLLQPPCLAIMPVAALGLRQHFAAGGLPPRPCQEDNLGTGNQGAAPSFSSTKPALTTATMNHVHTTIGLPTETQRVQQPSTDLPESQEGWGVPKKHRTQFSPAQLLYLEETFSSNQFPNLKERERIATRLDLTVQHVQIWFQNRRAKSRRKRKRAHPQEHVKCIPKPPSFWPPNLPFDSNFIDTLNGKKDPPQPELGSEAEQIQEITEANQTSRNGQKHSCTTATETLGTDESCTLNSIPDNSSGSQWSATVSIPMNLVPSLMRPRQSVSSNNRCSRVPVSASSPVIQNNIHPSFPDTACSTEHASTAPMNHPYLESISTTAISLMARAGVPMTVTVCSGQTHEPVSLPNVHVVSSPSAVSDSLSTCRSDSILYMSPRIPDTTTPDGNKSLSSLSSNSHCDLLELPDTDDVLNSLSLENLPSPIFAEAPMTLADILGEHWDFLDEIPTFKYNHQIPDVLLPNTIQDRYPPQLLPPASVSTNNHIHDTALHQAQLRQNLRPPSHAFQVRPPHALTTRPPTVTPRVPPTPHSLPYLPSHSTPACTGYDFRGNHCTGLGLFASPGEIPSMFRDISSSSM